MARTKLVAALLGSTVLLASLNAHAQYIPPTTTTSPYQNQVYPNATRFPLRGGYQAPWPGLPLAEKTSGTIFLAEADWGGWGFENYVPGATGFFGAPYLLWQTTLSNTNRSLVIQSAWAFTRFDGVNYKGFIVFISDPRSGLIVDPQSGRNLWEMGHAQMYLFCCFPQNGFHEYTFQWSSQNASAAMSMDGSPWIGPGTALGWGFTGFGVSWGFQGGGTPFGANMTSIGIDSYPGISTFGGVDWSTTGTYTTIKSLLGVSYNEGGDTPEFVIDHYGPPNVFSSEFSGQSTPYSWVGYGTPEPAVLP